MKYILTPIAKFLWAVILTIYFAVVYFIGIIAQVLWTFSFPKEEDGFFTLRYYDVHFSPYSRKIIGKDYKTAFHYIWNIK